MGKQVFIHPVDIRQSLTFGDCSIHCIAVLIYAPVEGRFVRIVLAHGCNSTDKREDAGG